MLNFNPYLHDGKHIGDYLDSDGVFYFFGNMNLSKEGLAHCFPRFQFSHLKQVHGSHCLRAPQDGDVEADAQWTDQPNLALVVQTADCLPVLAHWDNMIVAIHAGWRGVANNIIGQTFSQVRGDPRTPVKLAIGPHIQFSDFEIRDDAFRLLESSWQETGANLPKPWCIIPDNGSYRFNLLQVALAQAGQSATLLREDTFFHPASTFSSSLHHSFRRSRGAGRQYSFIALTR